MAVTDLFMYRGDDRVFTMTATINGAPLNITGATIKWTARRTPEEAAVISKQTGGSGVAITDGPNGVFTVTIASADTTGFLVDESLIWDAEITIGGAKRTVPEDANGKPKYGTLKVKLDVST